MNEKENMHVRMSSCILFLGCADKQCPGLSCMKNLIYRRENSLNQHQNYNKMGGKQTKMKETPQNDG